MIKTAVILATGHPAHSSQLLLDRPRSMLPALGKPLVVRVMEQFYRAGIRHYVLILGLVEGVVASYLMKQWVPDAKFEVVLQTESEDLLSCLTRTATQLNEPFVFASYNCFTHERFAVSLFKAHNENPNALLLTGARSALASASTHYYGVTDGSQVVNILTEQPQEQSFILLDYAICGQDFVTYLQTINRNIRESYGQHFLEIVSNYLKTDKSNATVNETSWILRVENDQNLLALNRRLLEDTTDTHILSELPYSVKVIPPVRIDPQVSVGESAVIGPNVYLEKGCSIGYGATVKNSVVLNRGSVPANTHIENAIISTRGPIT